MTGLGRLWRGELALAEAFWTWAVGVGLAINLSLLAVSLVLLTSDRTIAALIVGHALALPYNFLVTVGVWRSAARHQGDRGWADTARIATVIMMVLLSIL